MIEFHLGTTGKNLPGIINLKPGKNLTVFFRGKL
jgi:hypothetical protein